MKEKAYFNWSGGKDSALALYKAMQAGDYEIITLFTVMRAADRRVSMHEVPLELIQKQADSLGLPLTVCYIDPCASSEEYAAAMRRQTQVFLNQGITTALFGDIHLAPLRVRREQNCAAAGLKAAFPLWGRQPQALLREFIELGFRAVITCADGAVLDKRYVGRLLDEDFIRELPPGADICGENGEYHAFAFDGPVFRRPVDFRTGEVFFQDFPYEGETPSRRFWYMALTEQKG